ncbi:glycoside hydrolase family 88 protein [Elizabethkingia sp. JS20170427COW]|uniref:glycoside hydrolase family 88 protein n=1 Tax=Elizabethkingia sp. JS20170427COW TaxID=2583851 RepID=UPI00111038D5|nr:glycoside hydrolase family 88 protein [Elizabethkingia sp. JS20170427COW]QCX52403.1 glucuronyl hydrolase [Elizabethkingia sp. JS20170427COW]
MITKNVAVAALSVMSVASFAQSKKAMMKQLIQESFQFADQQFKVLMKDLPNDKVPQTYDATKNKVVNYDRTWWCTGFYPGSLWLVYEQTKDPVIKKEAERILDIIEPNQTYTGNHDLGFMMFCSFGNAYRITKDPKYKDIIFRSAESLASRYRPTISAIQSWNKNKYWDCPVIIDNMMNLEMLNWVSQNGGDKKYQDISVIHSNTTMKNHFRPDYSSYHVVDYDINTGGILKHKTWQGYSDESAWARGQAWGLYGYTMMYRFTKDSKYLDFAKNIAKYILNNPNMPEDKIPYWDFNAPDIPNAPRDASAGALIASALLELGQYTKGKEKNNYISTAETILKSLSSPAYRAKLGENGGFLLMHSTGALPLKSEIDVPLVYADYYFLEALKRYKDCYL